MACEIKVDFKQNKALQGLYDYCGTNCTQFYTYLTTVIPNVSSDGTLQFRADFVKEWKGKEPLSMDSDPIEVRDAIIKYFNKKYPSAREGVRKTKTFDKIASFGYDSISAREEGKRLFANAMIEAYHNNENLGKEKVDTNLRQAYVNYAAKKFNMILAKRLSAVTGVDKKVIFRELIKYNNAKFIEDLLEAHQDKVNLQLRNLIALHNELYTQPLDEDDTTNISEELITEIMADSRLGEIRMNVKKSKDEAAVDLTQQEESGLDGTIDPESTTEEAEYDTYIQGHTLSNSMGMTTTFMTHIGAPLRALLGSLPKMTTIEAAKKEFKKDTDNHFGIADVMDANQAATILYHYGRYDSIPEMMKSIMEIAQRVPGYAAFSELHRILLTDPNLQIQFFRTFRKTVIGKVETVVVNGVSVNRVSNQDADRGANLRFKLMNAIKSTAIGNNDDPTIPKNLSLLNIAIQDYNPLSDTDGSKFRSICTKLTDLLKAYYPDIDEISIRNFVSLNETSQGSIDYKQNMNTLYTILKDTIDGAKETFNKFNDNKARIAAAYSHNQKLKNRRENGQELSSESPIDLNPLYAEGYISKKSEGAAIRLAKLLVPYSLVSTPLNSRNVHGNQSSDVINSSMITNIRDTLQSQLNGFVEVKNADGTITRQWKEDCPISQLGKHRFQSKQYNFGPILLEHRENGKIVNYGLFRAVEQSDGTVIYEPTDYCTDLIKINLFNGASNLDDNGNALYHEMSKGDYIGTAWRSFFNASGALTLEGQDKAADYFMRIPSDAPKTFCITAPRYAISGLLSMTNKAELTAQINSFITDVQQDPIKVNGTVKLNNNPINVNKHSKNLNLNDFVRHLESKNGEPVNIKIPLNKQNSLRPDRENTVRIAFRYSPTSATNKNMNVYVMEGTYYDGVLHDAKFVGFKEGSVDENIVDDITSNLWNQKRKQSALQGGASWKVSTSHPIFRQFVNIFTQEVQDMATAGTVLFEKVKDKTTGNYRIKVDNKGVPVINKKSSIVRGNEDHNGLHPTYHFNPKTGKIYETKNGKTTLTGKVFTSDRFILYDYFAKEGETPIKNFGQEILDEAFDFFKTRTNDANLVLQFDKDGNIIITDEQRAIIEEKIKDFILAYIEHARERMSNFENFVESNDNIDTTTENLADFILNTHLAYVGFNDLFEGDTKFYKDTQTFLKRAKESQGSGTPYGLVDFTKPIQPGHNVIPSPLDNETFTGGYKIQMFDTFRGITVYNTIKTDTPMLEALVKTLTDKSVMGNKVLSEDEARALLYGPKNEEGINEGGYQNTTVNDAQSYITFDEWVRRITARGQLPQYRDLINRILDEEHELTVKDITEFIQVQKNFYYDQYYNDNTKTISPRQIKNAEFVLVPRLIRGTELEKVAELMRRLGVDQLNTVETSKAGQSERFELWDETGHIREDILEDLEKADDINVEYTSDIMSNAKEAAEEYNYNYLYTQQETQQHVDAENKAGIQVMKKLLDNIDENSPKELREAKERFFANYTANIQYSFERLMTRFGAELDENGNVKLNKDGSIKGLNYKVFFDALKEEMMRLGLDSNLIDYCTLDPHALTPSGTVMPNYMSLVASKFENVVQSLFNHSITRQTLPGFHAAQVTGMGFRKMSEQVDKSRTSNILQYHPQLYKNAEGKEITEREYKLLSDADKKNYTKSRIAGYVEIMLPAKNFGFDINSPRYAGLNKEEREALMLADLQEAGLDEIIGYRIPTEGKQSVCCMKVVGFTDDAYGSTIIVPDAWVSQTGSDFDIDSVYGIQYKARFDKDGKPQKHVYKHKGDFTKIDWFNYIRRNTEFKEEGVTKEVYRENLKEVKDEKAKQLANFKKQQAANKKNLEELEQQAFDALPKKAVDEIIRSHEDTREELGKNKGDELTKLEYLQQLVDEYNNLDELIEMNDEFNTPMTEHEIGNIKAYQQILQEIANDIVNTEKFEFNFKDILHNRLQSVRDTQIEHYNNVAKENGLLTLDEYLEQANAEPERFNSQAARNTQLLDDMKFMLTHTDSMEENLSRSNFDDVIAALDKCIEGSNRENERASRTAYNIFDQAEYQEDAMSGAKLKAFSVTRDTFCSICNTLHPTLENNSTIDVFYDESYDEATLKARFGENNVHSSTGGFIVTHTMFGWSNDNKNVEGKILTAYSSQTTAHILDAIKSGNIPNVNDLTFQVYKTILDIGSNYDTAVSFIMQPGITRVVEAYNNTNSIYAQQRGRNYVIQAVRSILSDLNIEYDESQSLDDLLATVNHLYQDAGEYLFGEDFEFSVSDKDNANVALNSKMQLARLKNEGIFDSTTPVEDNGGFSANTLRLLYDLQTILQYNKIDNLANNIREAARVSNPDKFGAKQTIFATRQVFDNMVRSIHDNQYEEDGKLKTNFRLQVDGNHILSALYPGVETAESGDDVLDKVITSPDFVKNSKYKPLAAFLKYATATSIKINKTLFITQSDEFVSLITDPVYGLASTLSRGNRISEKNAKDFQNYVVNYIVMQSEFLRAPLKYNMGKGGKRGFEYIGKSPAVFNEDEAIRVCGYGHSVDLSIVREVSTTPNYYEGNIEPEENTIFVFGSNPEGRHGKGAAAVAVAKFGAEYGVGEGLTGNAYALPTKDLRIKANKSLKSISKTDIIRNIRRLYDIARENPDKKFKVAYRNGLDETSLNGYTGREMISMFKEAGIIPYNVYFSKEWIDSGELGQNITEETPMVVEDINNPTQDEVNLFCQLSPAQKITFIKKHFRDAGVFRHVDVQLYNEHATRGLKAGTQTISFNEESSDIETVRKEFEDAFSHTNPLIACAAADIVKYSFYVEGYRMGMHNVSKMIPNSVLLNGGRIYGTNIINNTNSKMANIVSEMQAHSERLIERFVRSHSSSIGINFHNVVKTGRGGFELIKRNRDLIHINISTKEGRILAEKYSLISTDSKENVYVNQYVRLGFDKTKTLYKIVEKEFESGSQLFLIPLNDLDVNENAEWSANSTNNRYPSQDFYTTVIDNYATEVAKKADTNLFYADILKDQSLAMNDTISQYTAPAEIKVDKRRAKPIGNINENPSFSGLVNQISEWYKTSIKDGKPTLFVWNSPLSKYITNYGTDNGITTSITLNDGSIQNFKIYKLPKTKMKRLIKDYTGKHIDKDVHPSDKAYEEAINLLRKVASYSTDNSVPLYFSDIYCVSEVEGDIEFSTLTDVATESVSSIYRRSNNIEDVTAGRIAAHFRNKGIAPTKESVNGSLDDIVITTAKYLEEATSNIENKLKRFIEDPETGEWLAVDDIRCINLVKKDPAKRKEYLKTLLEPMAISKEFEAIKELDIDSEDPGVRFALNKIKKAVDRMQNMSMVARAQEKFAQEYYDRLTDNPLVNQGLISVLDGYYRTNRMNALFNDIQETCNPIVQIAMKNFQTDLRAKQMQARRKVVEFTKEIKRLEKEAKANGKSFDLNNVIDENGNFKQTYKQKLIQDRDDLKQKVKEAKTVYGENSEEHLKAQLDYDEWKAKYLEQEVVDEYYNETNRLVRSMLYNSNPKIVEDYVTYRQLVAQRSSLYNKRQDDVEDPLLDKQITEINEKISDLQDAERYIGESEAMYNRRNAIKRHVKAIRELKNKYYKYDAVWSFEDTVEENRRIVESYENSGKPSNLWANDPDYVKAKTWLNRNVDVEPNWSSSIYDKIAEAFKIFKDPSKRSKARAIRRNRKYLDATGRFNPRLVPQDEIKKLKEEQANAYNTGKDSKLSDRILISNAPEDDTIYTKEFYEGMSNGSVKADNPKWRKTITDINDLLAPYYDEKTGRVDISKIPDTDEGYELLQKLNNLYDRLSNIRGKKRASKKVKKFIEDNVDTSAINKEAYDLDMAYIGTLPKSRFRSALSLLVNYDRFGDNKGANSYLYGCIKPKKDKLDKFTDFDKTDAAATLKKYKGKRLMPAYREALYEARHNKSDAEFNEWIKNNHVYNPYTHALEPIGIWWENYDIADSYNYYPKYQQQNRVVRDGHLTHREAVEQLDDTDFDSVSELEEHYDKDTDFRNPNYKPNASHGENYKVGSSSEYDNKIDANEYELAAAQYIKDTLLSLANTQDSKRYFERGGLPIRAKGKPNTAKGWVKEIAKTFGWMNEIHETGDWYEDVDYSKDRPGKMPMLEQLRSKLSKSVPEKPKRREGQTDEDYAAEMAKWEKDKKEIEAINAEQHRALLDRDWVNVISDFIVKAATYNAIQDNKYELFYAQQLIRKYGTYITAYNKKGQRKFKKNRRNSNEEDTEYLRQQDKNLIEQLDNQIRRIVYDQFKAPNSPVLLKWMSTLQSLTSATYMMFNVKGGIANVTLGESQILGEAFAGEFFGVKEWAKGKHYYNKGVHDYILHNGDDKAGTIQGAIIKFMDIVDYDEHTGVSRLTKDAYEILRKVRDFGYTPQTAGEHGMQNSAMFTMMMTHRLFENPKAEELGLPKYKFMNFHDYTINAHEEALLKILTPEQKEKYEKYKERISSDADAFKEYAWFQKDTATEFARQGLTWEQQKEFVKARKEIKKEAKKVFEDDVNHPTLLSQMDIDSEGKLKFAEGSKLAEIDIPKENGDPSDALQLVANFKGRVISVNKYIHGVYDKSGRAQFENTFIGSLVMQYHKHLPLGIMKRYRQQGMWSEERGAVTKGTYRSLWDFIKLPFRQHKDILELNDEEVNALEGVQNIFRNIVDYTLHAKLAMDMMPEYDRANLRRMFGDFAGVLAAIGLTILIRAGADDDDEDSLWYNLALYETDRLATEAAQYIPFVAYTEAKKLWQSPIAAGSGVTDLLSSMNLLAHMIIDGDEFDGEYHSGKFAGESKLKVYLLRRIPMWRGIQSSFIDIKQNNSYYKIGENMLGFLNIKEKVDEWKK